MTNLEVALYWAAQGWMLFPCRWQGGNHKPCVKWKKQSLSDPDRITRKHKALSRECGEDVIYWCVNLGASGLAVLDVDVKSYDGEKTLRGLIAEQGEGLPACPVTDTPTGGRHLWFRGAIRSTTGDAWNAPGIDTRSRGGMVPCPGSVVPGKGHYMFKDHGMPLPTLPGWIADLVGVPPEKDNREPAIELDGKESIELALAYLAEAPVALEGDGGDAVTYAVACKLRDFGLSEGSALELMLMHYNDRCEPPWDLEELQRKVHNAYQYALSQPGHDTHEARLKDAQERFPEVYEGGEFIDEPIDPGWISMGDFLFAEPPKREWLVEGWIPFGSNYPTLLAGQGGTGKSLLSLQLAQSLATGEPWLGLPVLKTLPTCLVICEDGIDEAWRRSYACANVCELDKEAIKKNVSMFLRLGRNNDLAVMNKSGSLRPGPFMHVLRRHLSLMPAGPKVLIMDTVADLLNCNENQREVVTRFIKQCVCAIAMEFNATPILLSHPPKSGAEWSGSTAWEGSVRARLFLSHQNPDDPNDYRILKVGKLNYGKAGTKVMLRYHNGAFLACKMDELDEATDAIVMDYIREAYENDRPLAYAPQSPRCVKHTRMIGPHGPLSEIEIMDSIDRLMNDGKVEEIENNDHRGWRKGLIVVE